MPLSDLSVSTQNYLKTIWALEEWPGGRATPTLIADRVGLRLSTVSDALRKLAAQGLVDHAPYGHVTLTEEGRTYAVAMIRRHRLIETFLVRSLGYSWDQVHDEAEQLEHAVSDFMIERIDELLGHPSRDPHGDPIPSPDGRVELPDAVPLTEVRHDATVVVERIADDDPSLLQFFDTKGIDVGVRLEVAEGPPFSESIDARVAGTKGSFALGLRAAEALYVSVEA